MKVNCDMKVKTVHGVGVNIRSGPNITFPRIGGIPDGNVSRYTECQNGWYKNAVGWCCGTYLRMVRDYGASSTNSSKKPSSSTKVTAPHIPSDWEKQMLNSIYATVDAKATDVDDIRYVFGAPFQFTDVTDPRPKGSAIGRSYMETMLSDMSMLSIAPGSASFMKDVSNKEAKSLLSSLFDSMKSSDQSALQKVLDGTTPGRYYSFKSDYTAYMEYVNNMCRIAAQLLGIGDRKLDSSYRPYKSFDWGTANLKSNHSKLYSWLTSSTQERSVQFYIDGKASSFSDSISNSTDDSMLASAMGKGSDLAKEALFLFGKSYDSTQLKQASLENYEEAVQNVLDKLTSKNSKLKARLTDHASTLLEGGNIAFPQLWKDASYSKSYDITVKLVCPYADVESFYLYILVPLFHILALGLPKQIGANGYMSPFLVRAYCKGWFNCSLGVIDSISIKRASQEGWSVHGFPTEVEVTFSIKDLYENLSIARTMDASTFQNTEYLDMLCTWCGININKPDLDRKLALYRVFYSNKAHDLIGNTLDEYGQDIKEKLRGWFTF